MYKSTRFSSAININKPQRKVRSSVRKSGGCVYEICANLEEYTYGQMKVNGCVEIEFDAVFMNAQLQ